jgi:RNA polymerase sigma-70 factor (ECF subfamily)
VDINRIHDAIRSLPDGYRVVLSLHLIEGYNHDEISKVLNISNSASRTQYLRAKNKLKEILKRQELYIYN